MHGQAEVYAEQLEAALRAERARAIAGFSDARRRFARRLAAERARAVVASDGAAAVARAVARAVESSVARVALDEAAAAHAEQVRPICSHISSIVYNGIILLTHRFSTFCVVE